MNLENMELVELILKIQQVEDGYAFKIDIFRDHEKKSEVDPGLVFESQEKAERYGRRMIQELKLEYNLHEHIVH